MVVSTMAHPSPNQNGIFFTPYQGLGNVGMAGYPQHPHPNLNNCAQHLGQFEPQQPSNHQAAGLLNFIRTKSAPSTMENEAPEQAPVFNLPMQPVGSSGSNGTASLNPQPLNLGTSFIDPINFNWGEAGFTQIASGNSTGSSGNQFATDGTEFLNIGHSAGASDVKVEHLSDDTDGATPPVNCHNDNKDQKTDIKRTTSGGKKPRRPSMVAEERNAKLARSRSAEGSTSGSPIDEDLKKGDVGNYVARTAKGLSYDLDKVDEGLARRLIKNRVSAERSRQRKIQQWNEMVTSLSEKDQEIVKLQNQNASLSSENEDLKQRLATVEALLMRQQLNGNGGVMLNQPAFLGQL